MDSRFCSHQNPSALPLPRLSAAGLLFSPLTLLMAATGGRRRQQTAAWRQKATANEAPVFKVDEGPALVKKVEVRT